MEAPFFLKFCIKACLLFAAAAAAAGGGEGVWRGRKEVGGMGGGDEVDEVDEVGEDEAGLDLCLFLTEQKDNSRLADSHVLVYQVSLFRYLQYSKGT